MVRVSAENTSRFGIEHFLCRWLFLKRNIPITEKQKEEYLRALKKIASSRNYKTEKTAQQKYVFDHMYENLNILDGKTNSILQFNGILLAAVGIFLSDKLFTVSDFVTMILYNTAITSLLSVMLCHLVIWVKWSGSAELSSNELQERRLLSVRDSRTIFYRRAWWLSFISVIFLLLLILFEATLQFLKSRLGPGAIEDFANQANAYASVRIHVLLYSVLLITLFIYDLLVGALIKHFEIKDC